jgi:hypothetical protein
MVELNDAVTAAAAFVGGYLGQRHAGAKVARELRALAERVERLEERARFFWRYAGSLHRRVREVERVQGRGREA